MVLSPCVTLGGSLPSVNTGLALRLGGDCTHLALNGAQGFNDPQRGKWLLLCHRLPPTIAQPRATPHSTLGYLAPGGFEFVTPERQVSRELSFTPDLPWMGCVTFHKPLGPFRKPSTQREVRGIVVGRGNTTEQVESQGRRTDTNGMPRAAEVTSSRRRTVLAFAQRPQGLLSYGGKRGRRPGEGRQEAQVRGSAAPPADAPAAEAKNSLTRAG